MHQDQESEQAVVLTVPFPSEKRLEEVLYSEMESEEIQLETYNERLRCLFDRLADQFEEETVNIIVSHLFVMDSLEEGSERSIQLGGSYLADPDIFPKLADLCGTWAYSQTAKCSGTPEYSLFRFTD